MCSIEFYRNHVPKFYRTLIEVDRIFFIEFYRVFFVGISSACNQSLFRYFPLTTENRTLHSFIHSFIHSGHFYSAPSSPLPLRGARDYSTDTVSEFHAEAHRQLQVKDLPNVPT